MWWIFRFLGGIGLYAPNSRQRYLTGKDIKCLTIFAQDWENLRRTFRPLAQKLKIESDEDVERIFSKRV